MQSRSVPLLNDVDASSAESGASDVADRAMARCAEGDAAAFQEVFTELAPRLSRFLRRLSGSQALADDLVQETFFKLYQARGNFGPGMPVLPWAYAIARNCQRDAARAARRRPLVLEAAEPARQHATRGSPEGDGEQNLIARRAAEAVERALAGMTALRREAFVLIRYEGLSVAAAAQVLGASEGAVKLRAFQAYELLRAELAKLESH
jgi:RNA polymerase sigma-70 factor (ECF subfamily)